MKKAEDRVHFQTNLVKNEPLTSKSDAELNQAPFMRGTKIDLRQLKKGDQIKLNSSNVSSPLSISDQLLRGISNNSQIAGIEVLDKDPLIKSNLSMPRRDCRPIAFPDSKINAFRTHLKPMNKVTLEAFN